MDVRLSGWGKITIDGHVYDHDVVIVSGVVERRMKGASRSLKSMLGHTPLTPDENIPWAGRTLIIGTGKMGALPIVPELYEEARRRGVEVKAMKTDEACALLCTLPDEEIYAVLHTTC